MNVAQREAPAHDASGSALTAVKTMAGLALAGTGLYLVWVFVVPLLRGVASVTDVVGKVIDTAGDVAGKAVDTGSSIVTGVLGYPSQMWSAITGGHSSWKPNPNYTPENIAKAEAAHSPTFSQHGASLTAAMIVSTWSYLLTAAGKTPSPAEVQKFWDANKVGTCLPALGAMILRGNANAGHPGASGNDAATRLYWVAHDTCLKVSPTGANQPTFTNATNFANFFIQKIFAALWGYAPSISGNRPWSN